MINLTLGKGLYINDNNRILNINMSETTSEMMDNLFNSPDIKDLEVYVDETDGYTRIQRTYGIPAINYYDIVELLQSKNNVLLINRMGNRPIYNELITKNNQNYMIILDIQ